MYTSTRHIRLSKNKTTAIFVFCSCFMCFSEEKSKKKREENKNNSSSNFDPIEIKWEEGQQLKIW